MPDNYPFDGHDWSELLVPLGLYALADDAIEKGDDWEQAAAKAIRAKFDAVYPAGGEDHPDLAPTAATVRAFLRKLAEAGDECCHDPPLWRGLADVKNDGELLRYASVLLEYMWT